MEIGAVMGTGHLDQPVPRSLLASTAAPVPPGYRGDLSGSAVLEQLSAPSLGGSPECSETHQESELLTAEPQSKSQLTELCTKDWHK